MTAPWSSRQRAPSKRKIEAAIRRAGDGCSLCGRELGHAETTYSGYVKNRLEIVAECCIGRLEDGIFGIGVFFAPDQAEPLHKRDDREWFAKNPQRSHRLRRAHASETIAGQRTNGWVVVRQVLPGTRFRLGFNPREIPTPVPDNEELAHAIFDLLAAAREEGRSEIPTAEIERRAAAMMPRGRA